MKFESLSKSLENYIAFSIEIISQNVNCINVKLLEQTSL